MGRSAIEEILVLGTTDPTCHSTGGFCPFSWIYHGQHSQQQAQAPRKGHQEKPGMCLFCCFGFDSPLAPLTQHAHGSLVPSHSSCRLCPAQGGRSRAMCREAPAPAPATPFQCKPQFHEQTIRPDFGLDTNLAMLVLGVEVLGLVWGAVAGCTCSIGTGRKGKQHLVVRIGKLCCQILPVESGSAQQAEVSPVPPIS